jgi:DNA mismatch repair protein MutS2
MKSFGLVAYLTKLGIPIPIKKSAGNDTCARVDFFQDVIVELGDKQNLLEGKSTYMAQLHSLSRLIQQVSHPICEIGANATSSTLILLDELGGGTDPLAGLSIAQAILDKVLDYSHTLIVVTTHSTQLKVLSVKDKRFTPASVQLQVSSSGKFSSFQVPTYNVCYGSIGDSCALAAVLRSNPRYPNKVLNQGASLIAINQDSGGEHIRIIIETLEDEKNKLIQSIEASGQYHCDMLRCRDAAVMMARSYE